jgi:hypothetical protein
MLKIYLWRRVSWLIFLVSWSLIRELWLLLIIRMRARLNRPAKHIKIAADVHQISRFCSPSLSGRTGPW